MTRNENFEAIWERMHLPENYERYRNCCLHSDKTKGDELIQMYMNHIREYLDVLNDGSNELVENSCDSAFRAINRLLDEHGWEKQ